MTQLYPEDVIEFSVTHQIKIDSENSWVKLGITRRANRVMTYGESMEFFNDLYRTVNDKLITGIERAASAVEEFNEMKN